MLTAPAGINSRVSTLITDILASTRTSTSAAGRVVSAAYDPATLLTASVSVPGLFPTRYAYDAQGRLTSIAQGDASTSRAASYAYDAKDNLAAVTDPTGKTTSFDYDAIGRRTAIHRPDGTNIAFTYDANGNMTVLTTPTTASHAFGYTKTNLNNAYDTPLANHYKYIYDRDKRLVRTEYPSGKSVVNTYANGVLNSTSTPEGNIVFNYACGSNISSLTKGGESLSYTYDGKLITSEIYAGALNQTLNYTYNNDFHVVSSTYGGITVPYQYDVDDLLTKAGPYSITRNAATGLPESVSDTAAGGTLALARNFNPFGEQDSQTYIINGQQPFSWNLTRDAAGRIIRKVETTRNAATAQTTTVVYDYTYDDMGRLLTVKANDTLVEEYRYNTQGARVYEMNSRRNITGRTYEYSIEDHLVRVGDTTYQYDADGFLRKKTIGGEVTLYSYSSRGELLRVDLPDGKVIEYINDPLGRRIAKKINGAIVEKFLWQGLTQLLAVYNSDNTLLYRYEYADDRLPIAFTNGVQKYYMHYDQVGSLRSVTDVATGIVREIQYDTFGSIIADSKPAISHFAFMGGLYDSQTGLVRAGYRDYDPQSGIWTAKDPILFSGGNVDIYGYVENDPVNRIDPEGLEPSGERGASGGSSGHGTNNPYKHCRIDPTDPNKIICKNHQTGEKITKKKPDDWPKDKDPAPEEPSACDDNPIPLQIPPSKPEYLAPLIAIPFFLFLVFD